AASLWAGKRQALTCLQVVAIYPGRLYLLARSGIEVCPIYEPAPVWMELPTAQEVVGRSLGQGRHLSWTVQVQAEQAVTFVAVMVLHGEHGAAIRGPRYGESVVIRLGQPGWRRRTIGGCYIHIGGSAHVQPRPGHPFAIVRHLWIKQ